MDNHRALSCLFLLKLQQILLYLVMDPDTGAKKKRHFQENNSHSKNRTLVHSLQDAGFIPYSEADENNFMDVVERKQEMFTPTY